MPRGVKDKKAILALKEAIGRIDEDGCEVFGPDEMADSDTSTQFTRPSKDKIRRIAQEMAEDEAKRLAEAGIEFTILPKGQ